MRIILEIISYLMTAGLFVGVVLLFGIALLGLVRGMVERRAQRVWTRVFMLLVVLALGAMIAGMGFALIEMIGYLG